MPQETLEDKFAMLFHPSTPRASPTTESTPRPFDTFPPSEPATARPFSKPTHTNALNRLSMSSTDSFGSFVSVNPADDPLSLSFEGADGGRGGNGQVGNGNGNPTLSFFDRYSQDAKRASEARGRDLVGELMRHEEDPRVWLDEHRDSASASSTAEEEERPMQVQEPLIPLPREQPHIHQPELPHSQFSLDDIDTSYFTPPTQTSPSPIPSTPPPQASPPTLHMHVPGSSPRLLSLTPQPSLAPPIASTSSPFPSPTADRRGASEDRDGEGGGRPDLSPRRSNSYQTLSSISAKWIPSLFTVKSSSASSSPEAKQRSVDTIFQMPRPASQPQPPHSHLHPQQQQARLTASSPTIQPSIEQITHISSPFSSHIFTPISGAPGFKPEGYDWDKGYSGDLERELLVSGIQRKNAFERRVQEEERREQKEREEGKKERRMGEVIERRSGGVELLGRRESTVGVLTPLLADSIRPHLPALARLPRTWTLLYSLDQHGISINTLYTRCEAHLSNPKIVSKGALVVVQDSGDAVFGAWVGEGVKLSRGAYYGGGESFLWRADKDKDKDKGRTGKGVKVWKWTGRNDYVALCEGDYLSFGGGDGHYGLYLDSSLFDGSSAPCPTFANEPLCTPGPLKAGTVEFECVGLEVWGLAP